MKPKEETPPQIVQVQQQIPQMEEAIRTWKYYTTSY